MDIWNLCEGHHYPSRLTLDAWRVVEDQATSSTRQLVDSMKEHDILEQEIEGNKPPIAMDCKGFHYLLFTPFRYPPLKYGSRFGKKTESSLWYGSDKLITALAEKAYYRFVFILGSNMSDSTDRMSKTAFTAKIDTHQGIDLTLNPFLQYREHISSITSWKLSQDLGNRMRESNIHAFKYFSTRDHNAVNIGIFSCAAFGNKKPLSQKSFIQFSNHSSVEFIDKETQDKYVFNIEHFMVNGNFPFPPN